MLYWFHHNATSKLLNIYETKTNSLNTSFHYKRQYEECVLYGGLMGNGVAKGDFAIFVKKTAKCRLQRSESCALITNKTTSTPKDFISSGKSNSFKMQKFVFRLPWKGSEPALLCFSPPVSLAGASTENQAKNMAAKAFL